MRHFRSAILAALLGTCALAPFASPGYAQTCTCPGAAPVVAITADEAPPPLPDYDQPPIPGPGYMWTPGYWAWNNVDYYWVPGTWVEPPQPDLLWTPGYWGFVNGVYVFNRGYWGPHVGFYGGIDYGFGYVGAGYEGGHWENGNFYYNRTVNNFGAVHITNVYEKTVVVNEAAGRASFNGGTGGVVAKPTAEEEAAAKEQHVGPTKLQVDNTRAASMNSELFNSTNRGKPAIAATARPGVFTGPGIVRAKAVSTKPPAGGVTTPEKPVKPETFEKPKPPAGEATTPEKPLKPETLEKPKKPETLEKPATPTPEKTFAPKVEERKPIEKVQPEIKPQFEKPKVEPTPVGPKREENQSKPEKMNSPATPPHAAPPASNKPAKPECGRPGLPPCPK